MEVIVSKRPSDTGIIISAKPVETTSQGKPVDDNTSLGIYPLPIKMLVSERLSVNVYSKQFKAMLYCNGYSLVKSINDEVIF